MSYFVKIIFISFLTLASVQTADPENNLRGLRIDTGYFYDLYPELSVAEISQIVISKAFASGVNTLFIYAYNPVYGALYVTDYKHTSIEKGYGKANILSYLTLEAKKYGLKVIACVPVNNFKQLWQKKPDWRAKTIGGQDYIPAENMFLLSAWHPEFRIWLAGFYKDLITNNPYIDGLEIVEPFIDYRWQQESDYNPVASSKFKKIYPSAKLGGYDWLNFRAQGLTDLIGIMNSTAHFYNKKSYLVQTWPVGPDGKLFSDRVIKDNIGLDLNGILNLKGSKTLNYLTGEFMWQQWAAEYGGDKFSAEWTHGAAIDFMNFVDLRAKVVIHLEVTPFMGALGGIITPTLYEFRESLVSVRNLNVGLDVYDYSQIEYLSAWQELEYWF